jgi:hypothetical protein
MFDSNHVQNDFIYQTGGSIYFTYHQGTSKTKQGASSALIKHHKCVKDER